jgi:hypothetical protein
MIKNVIAPIQTWLLSQGKCVGCGKMLERKKGTDLVQVTCECGRIYMYDASSRTFRRATFDEIK